MEFWGVEIRGDKPVSVTPGLGQVIHLSQATLTDLKKLNEPVLLYAHVDAKKFVIGVLTSDKFPQLSFDLVFEKEFKLSHNLKNGSAHLTGYLSFISEGGEMSDFSEEDDDDIPLEFNQNGNGLAALPAAAKEKVGAPSAKKNDKVEEESDDSDDEDDDDESDEEMEIGDADDDSEDDESDEDEETPVKSAEEKKRPAPATKKSPDSKKVKLATPQKTDAKKASAHADTPCPTKNAGGKNDKSNLKTPKTGAQVTCDSCKKSFNSEKALDSHSKAKHAAK